MIKLKQTDSWSANAQAVDLSIFENPQVNMRERVIQRAKEILSHHARGASFGLCLRKEDVKDINVFISAITKVRKNNKKAIFYVSADDDSLILPLVKGNSSRTWVDIFHPAYSIAGVINLVQIIYLR